MQLKLLEVLPKFVSDSPDKMPSVNLVEGDLNDGTQRVHKLVNQLNRLEISVNKSVVAAAAAMTQTVTHLHEVQVEVPSTIPLL
jgi:hypothetical protein